MGTLYSFLNGAARFFQTGHFYALVCRHFLPAVMPAGNFAAQMIFFMTELTASHILLHALKHHYASVLDFIVQHRNRPLYTLLPQVKSLGASQFDMYTGALPVADLKAAIIAWLAQHGHADARSYYQWITAGKGHRTIVLPDESAWTLRFVQREDFVHVHPARYSPFTIRIKANAMKTAVLYLLAVEQYQRVEIPEMNNLRKTWLDLSPLPVSGMPDELAKVFSLLVSGLTDRIGC